MFYKNINIILLSWKLNEKYLYVYVCNITIGIFPIKFSLMDYTKRKIINNITKKIAGIINRFDFVKLMCLYFYQPKSDFLKILFYFYYISFTFKFNKIVIILWYNIFITLY